MKKKIIGIYGGTFDPPHIGHAIVAKIMVENIVDEVWFMPTPHNPMKEDNPRATADQRMDMLGLIASKISNVKVSRFEIDRAETEVVIPYTYDTLCALDEKYPEYEFGLIVGSDCVDKDFNLLKGWYKAKEIRERFGYYVYPRPNHTPNGLIHSVTNDLVMNLGIGPELSYTPPTISISSTYLREELRKRRRPNFFIPDDVLEYIKEEKLYLINVKRK